MMQSSLVQIVEQQNAIISIQAGVIDELFKLLGQHIAMRELDALPVVERINDAARIHAEIERELYGKDRRS